MSTFNIKQIFEYMIEHLHNAVLKVFLMAPEKVKISVIHKYIFNMFSIM